jgi:branched-chain amino acid transport system substrate-binding protein
MKTMMIFSKKTAENPSQGARCALLATLVLTVLFATVARAENGVTDDKILLGISTNLTGPSFERPREIKRAADLVFKRVNAAGGIHGRKIETIVYDDAYNPAKTVENAKKLADVDKVFALFQFFGAAPSKAALPFVNTSGIPYLFPSSGSTSLRAPLIKNVFNLRLGYAAEASALVTYLIEKRGVKDIGIVYQDDAIGQESKSGVQKALANFHLTLKGDAAYKRETGDVDQAFEQLSKCDIKAVVIAGVAAPAAAFVKKMRAAKLTWIVAGVTSMGGNEFLKEGGAAADGAILSQSFPSMDDSLEVVKNFKADLKAAGETEAVNIEGYVNALSLVEALKAAGRDLTRKSFMSALESQKTSLGGLAVDFGPNDHDGLRTAGMCRFIKQIRHEVWSRGLDLSRIV